MIDELSVSNVALIKSASLAFSPRFTVVTGETGSGKTALLSALKLILGERADAGFVREGCDALEVQGRFFLAAEPGADERADEDGHVVIRKVGLDGKSRVTLDGKMATVSSVAARVGESVDLCGQHEHQKLLKPASHAPLFDAWIGETACAAHAAYRAAFDACEARRAELERVVALSQDSSGRLDEARFVLERIGEVNPQPGELEQLEADLPRLENGEALAQAAHVAYGALSDEGGALEALAVGIKELEGVARFDPELQALTGQLQDAQIVLEDLSRELRSYRDAVDYDEEALERTRERHAQIVGLLKAYGPRIEDVFARRDEAHDLVSAVDDSAERIARATKELEAAEAELQLRAQELVEVRAAHREAFSREVSCVMALLEMPGAALEVDLAPLEREKWTAKDPQKVEFLFRPGNRMSSRPLAKVASGGEASRVMLAIKVVMGAADDVETLVFDEIDAGVGGATGQAVGEVLARLAATHQVIVVTHLAQIAVFADRHYVVDKHETDTIPETVLREVEKEGRVDEIARMLSGDASETSRAHARLLLEKAVMS